MKKNIYTWLVLMLTGILGNLLVTSCSDDIPADKYYTFTGEMMSDYLKSHEDYSEFAAIVNKASQSTRGTNLMDLLSTRGQYTCFAPTNEAVAAYLARNGYKSVDDIPVDICDTLARTHLVNGRAYNLVDFSGASSLPTVNMNDRYLTVKPDTVVDEDTRDTLYVTYQFNRSGQIIYQLANDSVENGIVQPVNAVLSVSNQTLPDLMQENLSISLFNEAMEVTGISEIMRNKIQDARWNPDLYEDKHVYSGAQTDYCHIPEHKYYKFTAFACPNDVLERKYGITNLETFYNYARSIYGGDEWGTVEANPDKMKELNNPLRRLIGYNCLDRLGMYDELTTICTIATELVNPTEWYSTMDSLTTIKCERLTVSRYIGKGENDVRNHVYLNRGDMSRGDFTPGVHVDPVVSGIDGDNQALNGVYYTTDGLADYGTDTKEKIFNTRIRMDLYTFFPEMMSNSIRDGRTTNRIDDSNNPDKSVTSPNYWFPNGYLDNVKVNEDGIFLFQSQHNTYWSYEGDEFNLASEVNSYDITFNLPSVPSGTYQIRLGFANMSTRGICQFYLDGEPKNIPFDMRDTNFEGRTGWFDLNTSFDDDDAKQAAKKNMHNTGWYHGPRSVFVMSGEGHPDGSNNRGAYFSSIARTCRFVLCTANLDERVQHTVRIKSVWAVGTALVMLDYFELVPKSVYGVEGEGKAEDDY